MMELLQEAEVDVDVSVITADDLLHTVRSQDRERILDHLNSRTIDEIERERALRSAAAARLGKPERRSGGDRRIGRDRRAVDGLRPAAEERRSGRDRRSGHERRHAGLAAR
jgi:hypothetical protein